MNFLEILIEYCCIHIDDILIRSDLSEKLLTILKKVFARGKEVGLKFYSKNATF